MLVADNYRAQNCLMFNLFIGKITKPLNFINYFRYVK